MQTKRTEREERLRRFLNRHRHVVTGYHEAALRAAMNGDIISGQQRVQWLFLKALDASGREPPLDEKARALSEFQQLIKELWSKKQKPLFSEFAAALVGESVPRQVPLVEVRKKLTSFPHIQAKKANLFLRDLVYYLGPGVFAEFDRRPLVGQLEVPIDVVHRIVYAIFHKKNALSDVSDSELQAWARVMYPKNPILFDMLWFWGHFSIRRSFERRDYPQGRYVRRVTTRHAELARGSPNIQMLDTDLLLNPYRICSIPRLNQMACLFIDQMLEGGVHRMAIHLGDDTKIIRSKKVSRTKRKPRARLG